MSQVIASVLDFNAGQFRRQMDAPVLEHNPAIMQDMADGIEAVHALMNLAYFSERPRAFIFAIATAALDADSDCVELYDDNLAALQNCSKRTVMRQRKDYLREAFNRKFSLIEIIEGEYDKTRNEHAPTRYRFRLAGEISEIVTLARSSKEWREGDREAQRKAIQRAAGYVYGSIPDAGTSKKRKAKQNRPATSEIETFKKIVATNLSKLQDRTGKLPPMERERLVENPGDLRQWWLDERAKMDAVLGVDSAQTSDSVEVDRGTGQLVTYPPPTAGTVKPVTVLIQEEAVTHSPETLAYFDQLDARLTAPKVRRRLIPLDGEAMTELAHAVDGEVEAEIPPLAEKPEDESPPAEVYEALAEIPPMVEKLESEAIGDDSLSEISGTDSDGYDYELNERIAVKVESGLSEGNSRAEAIREIGTLEEWRRARDACGVELMEYEGKFY